MGQFLVGCALGVLLVGCIAAPFAAPWRIRVRYLVACQVADPVFGFGPPRDITLRSVQVILVDAKRGHVDLVLDEAGTAPAFRRRRLTRESCTPAEVAKLDGWSALHEPLLLVVDEGGHIHLYGPDGVVTDLHRAEERTR